MANQGGGGAQGELEEEEERWSDWEESEGEGGGMETGGGFLPLCVPSTSSADDGTLFGTAREAFEYDSENHGFDVRRVVRDLGIGFYDAMKLVNYVRRTVSGGGAVTESALVDGTDGAWRDDQNLIPFLENDRLLLELDEALELDLDAGGLADGPSRDEDPGAARVRALEEENEDLKRTVAELRASLKMAGAFLAQDAGESVDKESASKQKNVKIDQSYFDSYAGFGIHCEMLSDRPRMEAYRGAIERNASSLVRGKDVLDVGCGTGILSMISARAGAERVCAVDGSAAIAETAREIVEENHLTPKIDVRSGLIEAPGTLPEGYACDVIVSEWMGYCLLYESMLLSVLHARDKYLREGGCVLPDLARIMVAGCDRSVVSAKFWDDVEGFSMRTVARKVLEGEMRAKAHVMEVPGDSLVTTTALVSELDLCSVTPEKAKAFTSEFEVRREEEGGAGETEVAALVVWFDTIFSERFCPVEEVTLTTSPRAPQTHWAQTLLTLPEAVALGADEALKCRLAFDQHSEDYRGLDIVLEYGKERNADRTYPHIARYDLV